MKRICMLLLFMMLFSLTACDDSEGSASTGADRSKYVWVLVDTEDYEQSEFYADNEGSEFIYSFIYEHSSYEGKKVYDGETRQIFEEKYIHGETYGAGCDFNIPPEKFTPGEKIAFDINLKETENTLVGWSGGVSWWAAFTSEDVGFSATSSEDIKFKDAAGDYGHELNTSEGIASINTEVTAQAPGGKKGDRIVLRTTLNMDFLAIGTRYIYELQKP